MPRQLVTVTMARRFAGILIGCGDEEVTRVFKNSEGYADPTAGAALAHIADEERRKAKEAHRLIDLEKEVDQQTSEYLKAKREALRLLERIKPESATILVERYFEGKTFIEIGKIIFVTERQAQRRCKEAIREFQRVLDEKDSLK